MPVGVFVYCILLYSVLHVVHWELSPVFGEQGTSYHLGIMCVTANKRERETIAPFSYILLLTTLYSGRQQNFFGRRGVIPVLSFCCRDGHTSPEEDLDFG